jgi:hypothetical protein
VGTVAGWGYVRAPAPPPAVLYGHVDTPSSSNHALLQLLGSIGAASFPSAYNASAFFTPAANVTATDQRLPPSSLQSFLQVRGNLTGVVLADYAAAFANPYAHPVCVCISVCLCMSVCLCASPYTRPLCVCVCVCIDAGGAHWAGGRGRYYHSSFDTYAQVNSSTMQSIICAAANMTAQAVWLSANPSALALGGVAAVPASLAVNCTTVGVLLDCLLNNILCDLVRSFLVRTSRFLAHRQREREIWTARLGNIETYILAAAHTHTHRDVGVCACESVCAFVR